MVMSFSSSSLRMTSQFYPVFCVLTTFLIIFNFSLAATAETSPVISNSVANYICRQQNDYQETSQIQPPLKTKPQNDDSKCAWYLWAKCEDSKSESCPSFVLKPCDEIGTGKKKGKGIAKQPRLQKVDCENVTAEEQGLANPQIVSPLSKYPSLVTIEVGHRCQIKYCTGLILNENWIIVQQTGCFYQTEPADKDVSVIVAGEGRMYKEEGTEQRRGVAEYIRHPGLVVEDFHYYKDNIGLVRLSEPLEFNENVQPIDLAAIEAVAPSIPKSSLKIVGWLKAQPMKEEDELLSSLIESPLDFVPIDDCYDEAMQKDEAPRETLICAGKCIIQGDKKNQPLRNVLYAQETPDSAPVPIGLGPITHSLSQSSYGVFTNLASFIPWIKENSKGQGQGQTTENPDSRIINGEDAPPYKYKSMVNIEEYASYACTVHGCGGSILSEDWFLTAAHCVSDWEEEKFRIVVGDHDIRDSDENEQEVTVEKVILHENYNSSKYGYDIAVVKVTPPFKFSDKIQKVTLPDPHFEASGNLTGIGWGRTEEFIYPHILKQVQLPFVSVEECQKLYADVNLRPLDINVCAGDETHDVCKTDSGGPLYQIDESEEQILVGIVSYGYGATCQLQPKDVLDPDPRNDDKFRPGVFTKVASFVDWIMKNAEMSS